MNCIQSQFYNVYKNITSKQYERLNKTKLYAAHIMYLLIKFSIVWLSVYCWNLFHVFSCLCIVHMCGFIGAAFASTRFDSVRFIYIIINLKHTHIHVVLNSRACICVASALAFWLLQMATFELIWMELHGIARYGMALCGDWRNKVH